MDDPELVKADYDLIKVYFPEFYVHNRGTFMYSKVIMCFNHPFEDPLLKTCGTLLGGGQAMYKRSLQVEDINNMGSLLYSHRYVPTERMCDKLLRMSGITCWRSGKRLIWNNGNQGANQPG
jgi:hypothetical protein